MYISDRREGECGIAKHNIITCIFRHFYASLLSLEPYVCTVCTYGSCTRTSCLKNQSYSNRAAPYRGPPTSVHRPTPLAPCFNSTFAVTLVKYLQYFMHVHRIHRTGSHTMFTRTTQVLPVPCPLKMIFKFRAFPMFSYQRLLTIADTHINVRSMLSVPLRHPIRCARARLMKMRIRYTCTAVEGPMGKSRRNTPCFVV